MILHHLDLERELEWTNACHLCEFVIESPQFLREIIKDITISEEPKELSISNDGKVLDFDKDCDVIFNPLRLDFNNKRAMTTLLKLLARTSMSEDFYMSTNDMKSKIVKYFGEIIDSENFEFEVLTDDFTMDAIAKAISIHIVGDEDDFVELLTDYVSMMSDLVSMKLFIFMNLRSLVSDDELLRFKHNLENHQINALLLEGNAHPYIENIPRLTVDIDECEI